MADKTPPRVVIKRVAKRRGGLSEKQLVKVVRQVRASAPKTSGIERLRIQDTATGSGEVTLTFPGTTTPPARPARRAS